MIGRVEAAFDFGEKLVQLQPAFITANPRVAEQFHWIKQADPHYLAHEFFNQAWNSFSFTETAISLEPAKVTFAASANTLDHLDAYHLTEAQQRFLQDIPDPIFQQTVRDFMINQQFRQDYWIKGPRRLSPRERLVSLRQQRVILNISRDRVHEASFDIPGEIPLDPERFAVVLDALADYRPRTIAALEDELRNDGIDLNAILHAILALMSRNIIVQVQSPEQIENARPHTERLNNFLINLAEDSDNIIHLASPVTGSAVILRRIPRLFLRALSLGHETPQAWAEWVWQRFALPNENRIKDAVPLPVHESLGNLMAQAHQFSTQLPRLRALGVL
ncbi:hypothetical protein SIID45300_03270 [Candidatus Magnetaquicoccaceae bacterium FCR-1]|uniref:Methyltransferase regulatory domain-containing protein n=2 Tax=Candidatus Magnetaquiglobus chichijimensis TaxID=3141448 RepID=A0ABQ0CDX8_9PROT